ncbi:MAG: hypothetical protein BGN83_19795 [Rhizobium sp. 63-7]|nr:MAG: hypothetical protein BGN83_19795 [Rhizobium sp. 63-7]
MTAINVFLRRDRAIMMTDATVYPRNGEVIGMGTKAFPMPKISAVLAVRGAQRAAMDLAFKMSMIYDDFDHMAAKAARDLALWHEEAVVSLAHEVQQDIQIVVAGWSERLRRPAGFWYDSSGDGDFAHMDELDDVQAPAPDEIEEARLRSIGCEPGVHFTAATFDPVKHGVPLMEAQRRMKIVIPDIAGNQPIHLVGGHILLSEVSRTGISQRVIHQWPDEPGELIRPAEFQQPASAGMSRQQRRAMERQKRFA